MKNGNKKTYEKPFMDVIEIIADNDLLAVSGWASGEDPEFEED